MVKVLAYIAKVVILIAFIEMVIALIIGTAYVIRRVLEEMIEDIKIDKDPSTKFISIKEASDFERGNK